MTRLAFGAGLLALALTGCAAGPQAPRYSAPFERQVRDVGNPSAIVARELAYARAVREDGPGPAARRFAAQDARVHTASGPERARSALADREARQWTPGSIHMSCDGTTAVSRGRYRDAGGQWGYYATVWERQRDYDYRFVFTISGSDADLTRTQETAARPGLRDDGLIVVEAVPAIRGIVGECAPAGLPGPEPVAPLAGGQSEFVIDDSFAWGWVHDDDGSGRLVAYVIRNGAWTQAVALAVDAQGRYVPTP